MPNIVKFPNGMFIFGFELFIVKISNFYPFSIVLKVVFNVWTNTMVFFLATIGLGSSKSCFSSHIG